MATKNESARVTIFLSQPQPASFPSRSGVPWHRLAFVLCCFVLLVAGGGSAFASRWKPADITTWADDTQAPGEPRFTLEIGTGLICGNDPVNRHDPLGLADWWATVERNLVPAQLLPIVDLLGIELDGKRLKGAVVNGGGGLVKTLAKRPEEIAFEQVKSVASSYVAMAKDKGGFVAGYRHQMENQASVLASEAHRLVTTPEGQGELAFNIVLAAATWGFGAEAELASVESKMLGAYPRPPPIPARPPVLPITPTAANSGARFGTATSNNYRATFFEANPALEGEVIVHHGVEQQALTRFPGTVTEAEIHSLENLRGIPKSINSDVHLSRIRKSWNEFYRTNPAPTPQQLLDHATTIDALFGHLFNPPVR
jgi:hypothetical protein